MSFRAWLSVVTIVVLAVIIFFSRHEVEHAWHLLESVKLWVLALVVPAQILVYYSGGETIFSYLHAKEPIGEVPPQTLARIALELNFVNHTLPSGGVSGVSYMTWRLGGFGVGSGRATMAQVVRYAMGFVSSIGLLCISVLVVTVDGNINRWMILFSSLIVTFMLSQLLGGVYILSSHRRTENFSVWVNHTINHVVRRLTLGRAKEVLNRNKMTRFFEELHHDYEEIRHDKKQLRTPLIWSTVYIIADVGSFLITFWALGVGVDPAAVLIAYTVASMAGFFVITPGGAGAYEALMVIFLSMAGVVQGTAIAGVVLTRVIVLMGTIGFGFIFYQHAILHYGNNRKTNL